MKFYILLALLFAACSTSHQTTTKTLFNPQVIRVDSRGCMSSSRLPQAPQAPQLPWDVFAIESYYEKLEYYYLLSAEQCLSDVQKCTNFESASTAIKSLLLTPSDLDPDVLLSLKHSNNKLLAMIAINSLFYQKLYNKHLALGTWLIEKANANNLTEEANNLHIGSNTYSFYAHNMATTSARTFMYVGLLENNLRLQQKALSQIPHVLKTLRTDGSLPIETRRGSRALRYSMQVLSDIIALLTLGDVQHTLYHKNRTAILSMAQFDLSVLQKNSLVTHYASDNFSPGPIADYNKQDISSLRSRLAWVLLLNTLETHFLEKVEHTLIDKTACSENILKNKPECAPHIQSVEDIVESPLGFTLGFNPRCAPVDLLYKK